MKHFLAFLIHLCYHSCVDKFKICFVTYKDLDKLVRQALTRVNDSQINLSIVCGLREEILEELRAHITRGIEIIVAGGANAVIARDYFDVPIVEYKISHFDYLNAIDRALALGKKLGLVTYKHAVDDDLGDYLERIGLNIQNIIYENTEELREKLAVSGVDVIIGASHPSEVAADLGVKSILIYPGHSAIRDTIIEAKRRAREIRQGKEKADIFQIMMTYSPNGFMVIGSDGNIIDYNKGAADILNLCGENIRGAAAKEAIPECAVDRFVQSELIENSGIIQRQGTEILQHWIRIAPSSALYLGAVGILSKVQDIHRLRLEYQQRETQEKEKKGFNAKQNFKNIIGKSAAIKICIDEAFCFAGTDSNVLIYGETGVGKEIFAQAIHNSSSRKHGAFIPVNCGALPENLLETELFGYDEGAFTGSRRGGKKGLFELAENGTIFLDEIGEISPHLQTRLLRVLQEKEIMHVGGDRVIPVNARVISATNKNLESFENTFRRDLLYRLNVLELLIPPLRAREDDCILIFEYFFRLKTDFKNYAVELGEPISMVLRAYSWQGNIRELQNVCERFCVYLQTLSPPDERRSKHALIKAIGEERLFTDIKKRYEPLEKNIPNALINELSDIFPYTKEKIAAMLGISRTTLWRTGKSNC